MGRPAAWLIAAAVLAAAVGLGLLAARLPAAEWIDVVQRWLADWGAWAAVLFALIYVLATLLMLPAWPLTVVSGAAFGLLRGALLAAGSATVGAALAFLIARYAARDAVARRLAHSPRLAAIDRAIGRGGWKIVLLVRLSPLIPFNLQNYFYGLTSIRFWPCVLASFFGMLPATFMYVYLGFIGITSVAAIGQEDQRLAAWQWALRLAGLAATVIALVYISRLARRTLREVTKER